MPKKKNIKSERDIKDGILLDAASKVLKGKRTKDLSEAMQARIVESELEKVKPDKLQTKDLQKGQTKALKKAARKRRLRIRLHEAGVKPTKRDVDVKKLNLKKPKKEEMI